MENKRHEVVRVKAKLVIGLAALSFLAISNADAQEDAERAALAERLAPVGQLCVQGQECHVKPAAESAAESAPASNAASAAIDGERVGQIDGEAIYNRSCMTCHKMGIAGAPVHGDAASWGERIEQDFATLLNHSINGIGAMPARGGNPNLSDDEVEAATAYLVESVMAAPEQQVQATATPAVVEESADNEGEASQEEAASGDNDLDGEALYTNSGCAVCHAAGIAGAPTLDDADAWALRIEQGMATMYDNVFNGIGAMPPRGGSNASDAEIRAAVDYMVDGQ